MITMFSLNTQSLQLGDPFVKPEGVKPNGLSPHLAHQFVKMNYLEF